MSFIPISFPILKRRRPEKINILFTWLGRSVYVFSLGTKCIWCFLLSFVTSCILNIHAYGVSLVNAIYSVLHRTLFLSLASSPSCFLRLTVTYCEMPRQNESTENVGEASGEVTGQSVPSPGNPELVQQVFGLFKDYLSTQLDVKGKQIETKQKIDKETVELKFKGNQK